MPDVRIYRPARSAMQSGVARTRRWIVEFEPVDRKEADPLMGWLGSRDTRQQVRLSFESQEAALAYVQRQGLSYALGDEKPTRPIRPKNYADNFRFDLPPDR